MAKKEAVRFSVAQDLLKRRRQRGGSVHDLVLNPLGKEDQVPARERDQPVLVA